MLYLKSNVKQELLQEKQGDITEDETVKFKNYLMGLGIADPVTKTNYKNTDVYLTELARELAQVLEEPIKVLLS